MKKTIYLLVVLLNFLQPHHILAQSKKITVTTDFNDDKSVNFYYRKDVPGSYFISVDFNSLVNYADNLFSKTISSNSGKLFTLHPLDKNQTSSYNYSYWYILGTYKAKVDFDFTYLIPTSRYKFTQVNSMTYLYEEYFGAERPPNWAAFQFLTEVGDTAYASRKGTVVELINEFDYSTVMAKSYQSRVNKIILQHIDGSLASYEGFEKDQIWVKLGETVFTGTALGTIGQYDKREQGQLRFSIFYLNNVEHSDKSNETLVTKIPHYAFINPFFLTEFGISRFNPGSSYRALYNNELLLKEYTKRELKKLNNK